MLKIVINSNTSHSYRIKLNFACTVIVNTRLFLLWYLESAIDFHRVSKLTTFSFNSKFINSKLEDVNYSVSSTFRRCFLSLIKGFITNI